MKTLITILLIGVVSVSAIFIIQTVVNQNGRKQKIQHEREKLAREIKQDSIHNEGVLTFMRSGLSEQEAEIQMNKIEREVKEGR
jgi:hypothetical protein